MGTYIADDCLKPFILFKEALIYCSVSRVVNDRITCHRNLTIAQTLKHMRCN